MSFAEKVLHGPLHLALEGGQEGIGVEEELQQLDLALLAEVGPGEAVELDGTAVPLDPVVVAGEDAPVVPGEDDLGGVLGVADDLEDLPGEGVGERALEDLVGLFKVVVQSN